MFYEYALTIPANTPITSPVSIHAKLVKGIVERVEVQFWAGCRGNVHVRIREKQFQLWPSNLEEWFTAENHTISFNEQYEITDTPYILDIQGYNLDTDYEHQIIVRFGLAVGQVTLKDLINILGGPIEVMV